MDYGDGPTLGKQGGLGLAEKDQHTLVAGCPHTDSMKKFFFFLSFFLAFICTARKERIVQWGEKNLGPTNEPVPLLPRQALVG